MSMSDWSQILAKNLIDHPSWPNLVYHFVEVYPNKFGRLVRRGRTYHQFATMFEARMWAAGSSNSAKYLGQGYLNHKNLFVSIPEIDPPPAT